MGLLSVGRIVSRALKDMGFYVNSDREYPSLIKGGYSSVQIDFSAKPIRSLSSSVDVVIALDLPGLVEYFDDVKRGGVLIHAFDRFDQMKGMEQRVKKRGIKLLYLPAREIAHSLGGRELMVNMVLLGLLWRVLGFDLKELESEVRKQFAKRPKILEIDLKCNESGYRAEGIKELPQFKVKRPTGKPKTILLDGNMALALGIIHCGVRAHYAYPMSPSSGLLTYLANFSHHSGMVVKQAEDEITAANNAVGSMFMGTRTTVATSGGGFDLMTETFSLAGMTETPLVIIVGQRPGPATGLPTWSCQGDLNLAIHAGHGEYGRMVIAASDQTSCYELIQHAMNYAETYQVPIVLLYEKVIAESQTTITPFKQKKIPIKRGLVTGKRLAKLKSTDRYKITKSGVSLRWLPGTAKVGYYGNSDEHRENGVLTELGDECKAMYDKRVRKLDTILNVLPEPVIYGPKTKADFSFVGWGSSKNTVFDVMEVLKEKGIKVNYLHYEYLWPLKTSGFEHFFKNNKNVHILEGNREGQLANLIEAKTGLSFKGRLNKYNGRPFFLDEVVDYISKNT